MGFPMARNLINAGYELSIFDIAEAPLIRLKQAGASICKSLKELGETCEIVIIMVRTTEQAEHIIRSEKGLLSGKYKINKILLMSTVNPISVFEISLYLYENGIKLLDCPVSGAQIGAEKGTLTVMVGGPFEVFEACKPILDILGKNIFYLGESGTGESAKLINNILLLININAVYEVLELAKKSNINKKILFDLIKVSTGNSWVIENWDIVSSWKDKYVTNGTFDLIYKDVNTALSLGEFYQVPLYLSSIASQIPRF